ncbi:MAG: hypothetical protein ACHQ1D_00275 [Nitrososphaerales archaeon]
MAQLDFYFKGAKINEDISNWRDFEIEIAFESTGDDRKVRTGNLDFVGKLADEIGRHNIQGLHGGAGILEAPEFKVQACGSNLLLFDGGIDTSSCETVYECDKVSAPLRHNEIDYFRDRASSFYFSDLAKLPVGSPGKINSTDYVQVPYIINSIPDGVNIMVSALSLIILLKEFKEIEEKTVAVVSELTGDMTMTTTSAISITAPSVAIGMAIGRVIVDILRITFYIIYLLFILSSIITLLQMLFDNIIQPVKYKKGIRIETLMRTAAASMGLTFVSSLYQGFGEHGDDVIIPQKRPMSNTPTKIQNLFGFKKIKNKDHDEAKNQDAVGYPDWTFAALIEAEEKRLNAEAIVKSNILYFEPVDFLKGKSGYTIPDVKTNGYKTNACELSGTYRIAYTLDDQETNTYDEYDGTSCQMTLSPNVVINKRNVLLSKSTEIILPYSLVKTKKSLTIVEEVFETAYDIVSILYDTATGFLNSIIKVINTIIKLLNKILKFVHVKIPSISTIDPMPPNPITARIGMMLLSSDFIGVPKILSIDASNNPSKNDSLLNSARALIDEHHYINFAIRNVDSYGNKKYDHNQWLIYENKEIPLCCNDFVSINNNNFVRTIDQKDAKIMSLVWNPYKEMARITYRVKEKYTDNLTNSYIIDGQQ